MWSLGCILGEMLLGKPFFPGSSTINQLERIMSVIPKPTREDLESVRSQCSMSILNKASVRPRKSLEELLPNADAKAMDMVRQMLQFNPDKRITASESLRHPYLRRFHNAAEEITIGYDVVPPVDDDVQLTVSQYRNRLYDVSGALFWLEKDLFRRRSQDTKARTEQ